MSKDYCIENDLARQQEIAWIANAKEMNEKTKLEKRVLELESFLRDLDGCYESLPFGSDQEKCRDLLKKDWRNDATD